MKRILADWKVWLGIAISALFLWLAFRKVDLGLLWRSLQSVNYWLVIPVILAFFFSHLLRAWRWQFLLAPIRHIPTGPLFSSLLIGYAANTFLPAHLGEFVRAYVLSKKRELPWTQVFASIVIERILDMLTLVLLMAFTLIVFPFPAWVKKSGIIMLAGTILLSMLLLILKWRQARAMSILNRLMRPIPESWRIRLVHALDSFLSGIVPLKNTGHYAAVFLLSFLIWGGYVLSFYILFHAFGFIQTYHLPLSAALVIQVVTTIAIVVPSSPGYVGTFHFLCQVSLGFFKVPADPGLGYAIVMHALSFLPVLVVGLIILLASGLSLKAVQQRSKN